MSSPFLIEVSSEAGRKVGGIYTVIQSKSRYISESFPDRYMLIGYYDERAANDVKFSPPPKALESVFAQLAAEGIFCHYGKWIYGSDAPIILIDAHNFGERLVQFGEDHQLKTDRQVNFVKFLLWKHFTIDSLMDHSPDFSENIVWAWAVGMLLEKLCTIKPYKEHALLAQFHEWIAGAGLLYCRYRSLPISCVFTTHATVLGRSLSAGGVDVLSQAQSAPHPIEISEAYRLKVEGKHQLEMQAAKKAHVFTAVSETVALECRYILGRYPDVITLNGLDFEQSEAEAKVRDLTAYVRSELLQLVEACFIPYYTQRYDNCMLTFISGRYEFTNKGFDIYIAALGKLNARIKKKGPNDERTIIGFIFAPSAVRGPKISVIKNYLLLDKIMEVLDAAPGARDKVHTNLQDRLAMVKGTLRADLDTMSSGFIRDGERPHINLFDLNYGNDEIIRACVAAGLTNAEDDVVKVLFYPTYLRPNDGLMNMNYYDIISGMDMGVFPSRYEPFGYTPLEAGLKFNVAVSTDSAGFGRYLQSQVNLEDRGVKVLKLGSGSEHAVDELADYMEDLYYAHHSKLDDYKEDSYKLMHLFDWKLLVGNYLRAYKLALERKGGAPIDIEDLVAPRENSPEALPAESDARPRNRDVVSNSRSALRRAGLLSAHLVSGPSEGHAESLPVWESHVHGELERGKSPASGESGSLHSPEKSEALARLLAKVKSFQVKGKRVKSLDDILAAKKKTKSAHKPKHAKPNAKHAKPNAKHAKPRKAKPQKKQKHVGPKPKHAQPKIKSKAKKKK